MYRVALINSQTKQPHKIGSEPVILLTDNLEYTVGQVMRNRDTSLFHIILERIGYDSK
jgi:hypothetical protein